jgi:hypothetical protein
MKMRDYVAISLLGININIFMDYLKGALQSEILKLESTNSSFGK